MPKLTIEFNEKLNRLLEDLARQSGTTKVDIIRRGLALLRYVMQETDDKNRRLAIVDENGNVVNVIVVI